MKCRCSIPLKASTAFVCMVDAVASAAITVLSFFAWKEINQDVIYFYERKRGDSNAIFNDKMIAVITFWILTLLLVSATMKIVLVYLAMATHTRKSTVCGQLWIVVKFTDAFLASLLLIASFTVGLYPTIAAAVDTVLSLLTLWHVKKLTEAFTEFEKSFAQSSKSESDDD